MHYELYEVITWKWTELDATQSSSSAHVCTEKAARIRRLWKWLLRQSDRQRRFVWDEKYRKSLLCCEMFKFMFFCSTVSFSNKKKGAHVLHVHNSQREARKRSRDGALLVTLLGIYSPSFSQPLSSWLSLFFPHDLIPEPVEAGVSSPLSSGAAALHVSMCECDQPDSSQIKIGTLFILLELVILPQEAAADISLQGRWGRSSKGLEVITPAEAAADLNTD